MASASELSIVINAQNKSAAALGQVKTDLGGIDEKAKTSSGSLGTMGGKLLALGAGAVAVGGVTTALKGFWSAAQESNQVAAQTEAVIKSTGGAAGLTAQQVGDLAEKLSAKSLFDDETIQKGENLLLTFTNIGKDVFPQATQAAIDMSQAMGQDLQSSVTQIGKALNDPIAGIGALSRVGVQFTEDQKAMIEGMVEAGDVAGAQAIIMAELTKQFGGSAEAAFAAAGPTAELQKNWENMQETIGQKLIPVVNGLAVGMIAVLAAVGPVASFIADNFMPILLGLAPLLIAAGVAITVSVVPALYAAVAGFIAMNAAALPWIALALAIGAAIAGLYLLWSSNFLGIQDITKQVIDFVQPYITTAMQAIQAVVETVWPIISAVVSTYIGLVKAEIEIALAAIQVIWGVVWPIIQGVVETVMADIALAVQVGMWLVKDIIGPILGEIQALFETIWGAIQTVIDTIAGPSGTILSGVTSGISAVYNIIVDKLGALGEYWSGFWSGLKGVVDGVIEAVKGAWDFVAGVVNSGLGTAEGLINTLIDGYNKIPLLDDIGHISISGLVPTFGGSSAGGLSAGGSGPDTGGGSNGGGQQIGGGGSTGGGDKVGNGEVGGGVAVDPITGQVLGGTNNAHDTPSLGSAGRSSLYKGADKMKTIQGVYEKLYGPKIEQSVQAGVADGVAAVVAGGGVATAGGGMTETAMVHFAEIVANRVAPAVARAVEDGIRRGLSGAI